MLPTDASFGALSAENFSTGNQSNPATTRSIQSTSTRLLQHRVFSWLNVPKGEETSDIRKEAVVDDYGVPARVVALHVREEIKDDEAFLSLPFAIVLVFIYSMSFLNHLKATEVRDLEDAITDDLTQNADWSYVDPGIMAHKNLHDISYFADFHTWLELGLFPILFPQNYSWSESEPFDGVALKGREKLLYLQHNRKIGGLQLAQHRAESASCMHSEVAEILNMSCLELQQSEYLDMRMQPEVENIKPVFAAYSNSARVRQPDLKLSRWFLYVEKQEELTLRLKQMEVSKWVDRKTSHIEVAFMTYNAQFDLLTLTEVYFFFSHSGHIWKNIIHSSILLKPYASTSTAVFDAIFLFMKLWITIDEIREISRELGSMSQRGWTLKETMTSYFGFWNIADWISILMAFAVIFMWINSCIWTSNVVDALLSVASVESGYLSLPMSMSGYQLLEFTSSVESLFDTFREADYYHHRFHVLGSLYPMVLMLRLFKAFDAQPRLAMLTSTLARAATDVLHFAVVFISIFVTFALMGTALFGHEIQEFSTFPRSFTSCFVMLMGDFDVGALWNTGRTFAVLWFISFQVVLALIMLNMLLAIIMDTYTDVKSQLSTKQTMVSHIYTLYRRFRQLRKHERVPLSHVENFLSEHIASISLRKSLSRHQSLQSFATEANTACSWQKAEIMTVESFQEMVPQLEAKQARRLMLNAVRRWQLDCETPMGMSEAMRAISLMHGQLESFIEKCDENFEKLPSKNNSESHEPLSDTMMSRLDNLTLEVTGMKAKQDSMGSQIDTMVTQISSIETSQKHILQLLTQMTSGAQSNAVPSGFPSKDSLSL